MTRVDQARRAQLLGRNLACPPCNVGPLSTPNYERSSAARPSTRWPAARRVFAGQRAEAFYVDLGSIFDLADLRPFQEPNLFGDGQGSRPARASTRPRLNVHSIAIQVPISDS